MPRPAAIPVFWLCGFGEGRASQFANSAAPFTTSITLGSFRYRSRNATGSAFTRAATSSIKHSWANVFCSRAGERSGPVKNGDGMLCVSARSDVILPVPLAAPPTLPATYEGTPLLLLL